MLKDTHTINEKIPPIKYRYPILNNIFEKIAAISCLQFVGGTFSVLTSVVINWMFVCYNAIMFLGSKGELYKILFLVFDFDSKFWMG